jgi:hypothetical protein
VEAIYFSVLGRRRVVLWTLVANGASFGFGMACWYVFSF